MNKKNLNTSWENVNEWYDNQVGQEGHYYHQRVIFPNLLPLITFDPKEPSKFLDLACGQGVLLRHLPANVSYTGVDLSGSLIKKAKEYSEKRPNTSFVVGNLNKDMSLPHKDYTHAAIILALQNIEHPKKVFETVSKHLKVGGSFYIVLNHPYYRIPRQSSWGIDEPRKIQYRRVDRYMSPMQIPINMHPGQKQASNTFSYHYSLATYSKLLQESGLMIELIDEWCSDKQSTGKMAKMENRARDEIPLFMLIKARKIAL